MDWIAEWVGDGQPHPKVESVYTIGRCGALDKCWTLAVGKDSQAARKPEIIDSDERRIALYFMPGVSREQRLRAIIFFRKGMETAL